MNLEDAIAAARHQLEGGEAAVARAIAQRDAVLISVHSSSVVWNGLRLGLMMWRKGDDPRGAFSQVVKTARRGREVLLAMYPSDQTVALPVERLWFMEDLLGEPRTTGTPPKVSKVAKMIHLDRAMLATLSGHVGVLDAELDRAGGGKRKGLMLSTYAAYSSILRAADRDAQETAVRQAEECFVKRSTSREFEGLPATEAGGTFNEKVVDYRLAAVLRRVGYQGPSMHAWRWT